MLLDVGLSENEIPAELRAKIEAWMRKNMLEHDYGVPLDLAVDAAHDMKLATEAQDWEIPHYVGEIAERLMNLQWLKLYPNTQEAILGDFAGGDGVRFTLEYRKTCYRRGPWRLLIEVASGPGHFKWGCLDGADQPERNYHEEECAKREAQSMADVLLSDRGKHGDGERVKKLEGAS